MKIFISVALLFAACGLNAAELSSVNAADIKIMDAAALPAPVPAHAEAKTSRGYQNVFMQVRNQPSWGAVEASDFQLRIDISVRKVFNGQYDMFNRVDNQTQMGSIRKAFNSDWELSGYGSNLSMREFAGTYTITGNVPGTGAQSRYINLNVSPRYDGLSYYVSGSGLNLSADQYAVNGSYDPDQFSKQAFTSVLSLIFAAQAEKSQPSQP